MFQRRTHVLRKRHSATPFGSLSVECLGSRVMLSEFPILDPPPSPPPPEEPAIIGDPSADTSGSTDGSSSGDMTGS
jgi:hypothetical protein